MEIIGFVIGLVFTGLVFYGPFKLFMWFKSGGVQRAVYGTPVHPADLMRSERDALMTQADIDAQHRVHEAEELARARAAHAAQALQANTATKDEWV